MDHNKSTALSELCPEPSQSAALSELCPEPSHSAAYAFLPDVSMCHCSGLHPYSAINQCSLPCNPTGQSGRVSVRNCEVHSVWVRLPWLGPPASACWSDCGAGQYFARRGSLMGQSRDWSPAQGNHHYWQGWCRYVPMQNHICTSPDNVIKCKNPQLLVLPRGLQKP